MLALSLRDHFHATFFSTSNIGGRVPTNTVSLTITADQPINGYTVIGALDAQGLTVVQALTQNDLVSNYEVIGSNDGDVLVAIPHLVESESGEFSADYFGGTIAEGLGSTADATSSLADIQLNALPAEFQETLSANGQGNSFTFTDDPFPAGAIVIAAHEVTNDQYLQFFPDFDIHERHLFPESDCPIGGVTLGDCGSRRHNSMPKTHSTASSIPPRHSDSARSPPAA